MECNRFNIGQGDVERSGENLPAEFMDLIRRRKAWMTLWARGDCQAFRKEFVAELGGYDEDFLGWGYLDSDLEQRCERAGWSLAMINTFTSIAHQGHEGPADEEGNQRLAAEKKGLDPVRNRGREWGKL